MKRKFYVLLILIFFIISVLTVNSYAAPYNFTTSMTASSQTVQASSEVVVTVKVSNLNVGENGINGFTAFISYDGDVFEPLTDSSVEGNNDWVPAYAPGTGKVSLKKTKFVKADEEIMQISLKTKAGLAAGTQGQVKLDNITASNSGDDISSAAVSTTITIGSGTANPPTTTPTPIPITNNVNNVTPLNVTPNNNTNRNTNNSSNRATNNSLSNLTNNQVENKADNDIPYTGTESGSVAKIIIGVILIALIVYIKIERMKDIK